MWMVQLSLFSSFLLMQIWKQSYTTHSKIKSWHKTNNKSINSFLEYDYLLCCPHQP